MILELALVAVLPALLIAAAAWDLTSFTIPNILPAAMAILFVVFAASAYLGHDMNLADLGMHAAAGIFGLVAGITFFAFRWIGGGDAKLFAAAALWLGWSSLFDYALLASLMGGALTLGVIALRKHPLPAAFSLNRQPWLLRLADNKSGVPYGVALAAAALMVLPHTELFRLAVG